MNAMSVGNDTDVAKAVDQLTHMQLSSFYEMLDAIIECRMGVMRDKISDGYTIQQALMGKTVNTRPVLLTHSEIQSIRFRGSYPFIADSRQMVIKSIPIIQASLMRIGVADALKTLGITIGAKRDKFHKTHIVFLPVP